jgi:hypothetical protein
MCTWYMGLGDLIDQLLYLTVQTAASRLGSACAAAVSIQSSSLMSWVSPEEALLESLKQVREVWGGRDWHSSRMPVPRGFLGNVGWGTLVFVCSVTPRQRRSWTDSGEGSLPCLKPAGRR